jgi:hypothetical protein
VSGGSAGSGRIVNELARGDHEILSLLLTHRVLTTPHLIALTTRPERTVGHRLNRLRSASLVDRTRPYADSGSAPYYWWLTRQGAHVVEGVSPSPGKASPNPLFLRHTAAIAGLYVALVDVGPHVGLEGVVWRRDESSWEEWSTPARPYRHMRPDAHFSVGLGVDGEIGQAGGFFEVDFATMDQKRLRAKVLRHRDYASERPWWNRHPGCPALLLVTTSEARVSNFLASVEASRPKPSPFANEDTLSWEPVVAACACVAAPEEAVSLPVWRTAPADAPSTLTALLTSEVRKYRVLVSNFDVQQARRAHTTKIHSVHALAKESELLAEALDDAEGSAVVKFLFDKVIAFNNNVREQWAAQHLALVVVTHSWWFGDKGRMGGTLPPAAAVAGWQQLYRSMWAEQARALLERAAASIDDPRLRRPAAVLAQGQFVDQWQLQDSGPLDGPTAAAQAAADYKKLREQAVGEQLHALPLHRRLGVSRAALDAEYDARHLVICVDCGIARHEGVAKCPLCGGALVGAGGLSELPPSLAESLAMVESRLAQREAAA